MAEKNMVNEGPKATTPILTRTGVSRTKKWTTVGVLSFINVMKYMDRQSLAAVLEVKMLLSYYQNKSQSDFQLTVQNFNLM